LRDFSLIKSVSIIIWITGNSRHIKKMDDLDIIQTSQEEKLSLIFCPQVNPNQSPEIQEQTFTGAPPKASPHPTGGTQSLIHQMENPTTLL
jgi:hypothetical protein